MLLVIVTAGGQSSHIKVTRVRHAYAAMLNGCLAVLLHDTVAQRQTTLVARQKLPIAYPKDCTAYTAAQQDAAVHITRTMSHDVKIGTREAPWSATLEEM